MTTQEVDFQRRKFALELEDHYKRKFTELLDGNSWLVMVRLFHKIYGRPLRFSPQHLTMDELSLRRNLIKEEFEEFEDASWKYADSRDSTCLHEMLDAMGDMIYVILGTFVQLGINPDDIMREIQRSNMSKLGADGKPIVREDGKILKGPNFFEPSFAPFLRGIKGCFEPDKGV